jgi:hypothetical protein
VFFFYTFPSMASLINETLLSGPSPHALMNDICDDNEVTSFTYVDDVIFTYRDVVATPVLVTRCHTVVS